MKFKTLENVTRSQIEDMDYETLEGLVTGIAKEAQAAEWRKMIGDAIDRQEASIVTPKVVV